MNDPVIIIGAPRSGTNMLRDALVQLPDFGTWPCDEINYIWRFGNARIPTDQLTEPMASDRVRRYIRSRFDAIARQGGFSTVVEKTCANSLRVGFVDKVIPEARYIFIYRDGIDVVGSSMDRWTSSMDIPYLLRKARYVPVADIPYYGIRYLSHRIHRWFSREKRLGVWGPVTAELNEMRSNSSLLELCAHQWLACVTSAEADLGRIDQGRVIRVKYESFVTNPAAELSRIAGFLGVEPGSGEIATISQQIRDGSVGLGYQRLSTDDLQILESLLAAPLQGLGYRAG